MVPCGIYIYQGMKRLKLHVEELWIRTLTLPYATLPYPALPCPTLPYPTLPLLHPNYRYPYVILTTAPLLFPYPYPTLTLPLTFPYTNPTLPQPLPYRYITSSLPVPSISNTDISNEYKRLFEFEDTLKQQRPTLPCSASRFFGILS